MGYAEHKSLNLPLELLGYNLVGGEGLVWVDLFWRSTAKHRGGYSVSVELEHPETRLSLDHMDGTIPEQAWKVGDLYGEQMVMWLDNVSTGSYSVRVSVQELPASSRLIDPPWPGDTVVLDRPLVVLPASAIGEAVPEDGGIFAYTLAGPHQP
jgi:hypothetical protein